MFTMCMYVYIMYLYIDTMYAYIYNVCMYIYIYNVCVYNVYIYTMCAYLECICLYIYTYIHNWGNCLGSSQQLDHRGSCASRLCHTSSTVGRRSSWSPLSGGGCLAGRCSITVDICWKYAVNIYIYTIVVE